MKLSSKSVFVVVGILSISALIKTNSASAQSEGDLQRGGKLYYAWDRVLEQVIIEDINPLWEERDGNLARNNEETWRCATCHGWDYKGENGVSKKGSDWYTGFPGLIKASSYSSDEIEDWLDGTNNPDHDYSLYFKDQEIIDLSEFIREGIFDMSLIIDDKLVEGIGAGIRGEEIYKNECKPCHGIDGSKINFGNSSLPIFLGRLTDYNPWQVAHFIKFGHIESSEAPDPLKLRWSIIDIADLLNYLKLLYQIPGENANTNEIDYVFQGETNYLIIAAVGIFGVSILGIFWSEHLSKRK